MTGRQPLSRILVGFDGSAAGQAALSWGAQEARRSGAELVVLHAWGDLTRCRAPYLPGGGPIEETDRKAIAETVVSQAVATARAEYPELAVRPLLCRDRAARALPRHSETADLLVLGGLRPAAGGGYLGATLRACLALAACPTVVVTPDQAGRRRNAGMPAPRASIESSTEAAHPALA
ncbi:universal stress protein [Streptosporangium sp. NPDC023825]|uniref:universal stress protein n=1 Tax=Streptosporangium sp. NPDC023825 TaxID=3154909 RepID=UPI0034378AFA